MTELSKINIHGQVSIPAKFRKNLGLKPGDWVEVRKDEAGKIILYPVTVEIKDPLSDLKKYGDRGVDLTLLWENLKRTPTERLQRHQAMLTLVEEARKGRFKKNDRHQKTA